MSISPEGSVVALTMFAAPAPQEDPTLALAQTVVCETTPQAEWSSFCWEWRLRKQRPPRLRHGKRRPRLPVRRAMRCARDLSFSRFVGSVRPSRVRLQRQGCRRR